MYPAFDSALKLAIVDSPQLAAILIGQKTIKQWLNVELPQVKDRLVDLLGETEDGELIHIEIQSTNDPSMAKRMAEYGLLIYEREGRFPQQIVLYFGRKPMQMPSELRLPNLSYEYQLLNIRDVDGDALIESGAIGDNIIGLLARLQHPERAVRAVLNKVAALSEERRVSAVQELMVLAGLRPRVLDLIIEESKNMPISTDIREHPLFQRNYDRGREEGRSEGRAEGALRLLRDLLTDRFGVIPPSVDERLGGLSADELNKLGRRLLAVSSIEELFE